MAGLAVPARDGKGKDGSGEGGRSREEGLSPHQESPHRDTPAAAQHQSLGLRKTQGGGGREEEVPREEQKKNRSPCSLLQLRSATCTWEARLIGDLGSQEAEKPTGLILIKAKACTFLSLGRSVGRSMHRVSQRSCQLH